MKSEPDGPAAEPWYDPPPLLFANRPVPEVTIHPPENVTGSVGFGLLKITEPSISISSVSPFAAAMVIVPVSERGEIDL